MSEMDVEALQAQIDLSNSIAYDVVSSWMKPSASTPTVPNTISRELEEYIKRPPRLGLGAKVSKSSISTSREAAKLKGKLTSQRHARDEVITNGAIQSQDDEDEGESRSAAITKKKNPTRSPRTLDILGMAKGKTKGFTSNVAATSATTVDGGGNTKKRKRPQEGIEDIPDASKPSIKFSTQRNPFVIPKTPVEIANQLSNPAIPHPNKPVALMDDVSPSKKKHKKKNKKKQNPESGDAPVHHEEEEWAGFSPSLLEDIRSIVAEDESPSTPPKDTTSEKSSAVFDVKGASKLSLPSSKSIVAVPSSKPTSPAPHLQDASVSSTLPITTLLNLGGLPSEDVDGLSTINQMQQSPDPKKKRTRRRKSKGKKLGNANAPAQSD